MKKIIAQTCFIGLLTIGLLSGCSQDDELLIRPVKEYKTFTMNGFVLGESLEQYFNGVKARDLYQRIQVPGQIGFDEDEIRMELKSTKTGEIIYEQVFNISETECVVPKFYFDGETFQQEYLYPAPSGNEYKANFYFDFPVETGNVDVVAEVMEYYYDWENDVDPVVMLDTISVTLASNLETGLWTGYVTLPDLSGMPKSRPDSELWTIVCVKKSGTNEYVVGESNDRNVFSIELPQSWTTEGKTQSIYVGITQQGTNAYIGPYYDLVQIFQ